MNAELYLVGRRKPIVAKQSTVLAICKRHPGEIVSYRPLP
jgi:hypothetical protein